ncbi:MAG: class I SAM-dependent methyltransferase [Terriglobales bacterium]
MPVPDATVRFSSRVDQYVRYRPSYPGEVVEFLRKQCGLSADAVIADVASGTGIFTRILLENGNRVFGVEPNAEMRQAGEKFLAAYPRFTSVAGTAEATTLPDRSVDMVTAAQAAHWFDRAKARHEFVRILKPGGWAVLIWNERRTDTTAFLRDYEKLLLTYGTDYQEVRHERTTDVIASFFEPSPFQSAVLDMRQVCDYDALEGRLLSSSYTPGAGQPGYESMLHDLRQLFDAHQVNGHVVLAYATRVYCAQIT